MRPFFEVGVPAPGRQAAQRFEQRLSGRTGVRYLLFLPKGYQVRGRKRWPLILFLHGAGERGSDLRLVAKHGPPRLVRKQPDFPFIVVSPQCPSGRTWADGTLLALLEAVTRKRKVDVSRVYVTGLSMGGYATWSLGLTHPERFAAIAPVCGGGDTMRILLPGRGKGRALRTLPVWAFHGGRDPVVDPEESRRMVAALRKAGNNAKLTEYPEARHDAWTQTYNNPALYDWFLAQRRKRRSRRPAKLGYGPP